MRVLRILVVEDNALIGMLLAEMLEQMGHEVCAVENTEATAVNTALCRGPDLLIVDAQLGDGSGIAAVDEILRFKFTPHFFISGDSQMVQALRPNAVVIQKPFFEPDLARAIRRTLDAVAAS
jgi:two-component system, response regulator PdtaR